MNDISLPDFHLRFVDNLETVSHSEQRQMLLDPGPGTGSSRVYFKNGGSIKGGTPKWMIYKGKPYKNG